MQYNKDEIKKLIGQSRLDEAVDILLELSNNYLSTNPKDKKFVARISDALLINSGKLNGLIHDANLGILSPEEKSITRAEVNKAILYVIEQLPDTIYQPKHHKGLENNEQSRLREGVKNLHTSTKKFEYDIFLSFSSKDREEARQVWEKLRGYGLKVFLSDEALKINIGTSFFEKINYGLANSKHLVWLCTPNALQSKYVRMETETFFNQFFEDDRRLIILKGKSFSLDLLLPIYQSLQVAESSEQIVHALVDEAKQLKIENKKIRIEQEAAEQKRIQEIEARKQREQEELERKALEEFEHRQKEEELREEQQNLKKLPQSDILQRYTKEFGEQIPHLKWIELKNEIEKEYGSIDEEKLADFYDEALQKTEEEKQRQLAIEKQIPAEAREFIEQQRGEWNHRQWLGFKNGIIENYGDIGEMELGGLLENAKKQYIEEEEQKAKKQAELKRKQEEERKAKEQAELKGKQKKSDIIWQDDKFGYFTDERDGEKYKVVKIGSQVWMAENLRAIQYNDSTPIPNVTDNDEWTKLTTPAFCWYKNAQNNKIKYGALYNLHAVDTKKLAPKGWHMPTDDEWKQLEMHLGMTKEVADKTGYRGDPVGKKLKSTSGWKDNGNGDNESGFTALPGGWRDAYDGSFNYVGKRGYWWSSTPTGSENAYYRDLDYHTGKVSRNWDYREYGFSVRCVKDN